MRTQQNESYLGQAFLPATADTNVRARASFSILGSRFSALHFKRWSLALLAIASLGSAIVVADPPEAAKKVPIGKNVFLEVQGERRRVLIETEVCLRQGPLEQLLCRKNTKEHEAILRADVDGRDIHKALLVAGAKPGSPVKFRPKYQPATGTPIQITLEFE